MVALENRRQLGFAPLAAEGAQAGELADLRQERIIEKKRGQIEILKPDALSDPDSETLWL